MSFYPKCFGLEDNLLHDQEIATVIINQARSWILGNFSFHYKFPPKPIIQDQDY